MKYFTNSKQPPITAQKFTPYEKLYRYDPISESLVEDGVENVQERIQSHEDCTLERILRDVGYDPSMAFQGLPQKADDPEEEIAESFEEDVEDFFPGTASNLKAFYENRVALRDKINEELDKIDKYYKTPYIGEELLAGKENKTEGGEE